jgi:hypothetical protein
MNTLNFHWCHKWPGNYMENLAYGNGVLLVPEENGQTQEEGN